MGGVFDSPITSEKSGVTFDVTDSQKFRSTVTDGDPTMLNGVERAGSNSAVDVIPTVNKTDRGLMTPTMLDSLTSHEKRIVKLENRLWRSNYNVGSYCRYVIGIINIDNSYPHRTSIFIGSIRAYRSNGLYDMCNIQTTICKAYNSSNLFSSYLSIGGTPEVFRPVTFTYNGVRYGGFEYKMGNAETHYIELEGIFAGTLDPILVDFHNDQTGAITNVEIENSLTVQPFANSQLYYNGTNVWKNGDKITNAVWNDYAELFERGSKSEPGDLIALDINSDKECYILADKTNNRVVGVHTDEYGFLIGGEQQPETQDYLQYNLPRFIPVGLAGRCHVKLKGTCKRGDYLVPSDTPGVAEVYNENIDNVLTIFGIACENKTSEDIERVRVYLK